MKFLKRLLFVLALTSAASVVIPDRIQAQCPMCRMTAEGNLKEGGSAGKGLNKGIIYMLSMPYVLVLSIGYIWYRNQKNKEEVDEIQLES